MVQVLKEELRQSIVASAQTEFAKLGYDGASVKRIAAGAGISTGNLYRYYKDKADLFDAVVLPAYRELEMLMSHHEARPPGQGNMVELIIEALTSMVDNHRTPLLILIDGAKGTRHEGAVQGFFRIMADNVAGHLADGSDKGGGTTPPSIAWPIAVAFLQGYFEIIRLYEQPNDYKNAIRQYLLVWFRGLQAIL